MADVRNSDLFCIERNKESFRWTGGEFKSQVTRLAPISDITGSAPIVVTKSGRSYRIAILSATTGRPGAVQLSNPSNAFNSAGKLSHSLWNSTTTALVPRAAKNVLDLKANADGSNATGTWNINVTGNVTGNITNADLAEKAKTIEPLKNKQSDNSSDYRLAFFDDRLSSYRPILIDNGLSYNPASNTVVASTFKGNLNGTASKANSATSATNATNATNTTNCKIASDSTSATRYLALVDTYTTNNFSRIKANSKIYVKPSSGQFYATGINVTSVAASTINLSGTLTTSNAIICKDLRASRNISADGWIQADGEITAKKDIKTDRAVKCREVDVTGTIDAGGNISTSLDMSCKNAFVSSRLTTKDLTIQNNLTVTKNINVDSLTADSATIAVLNSTTGSFSKVFTNSINVNEINRRSGFGPIEIDSIKADTISVDNKLSSENISTDDLTVRYALEFPNTGRGIKFGPGNAINDDAHIEWLGGNNAGFLRISTSDDNGTSPVVFGDYTTTNKGGNFTEWARAYRGNFKVTGDITATRDIKATRDVTSGRNITAIQDITASRDLIAGRNVKSPSDIRLKENIKNLEGSLDNLKQIRGVEYDRIDLKFYGEKDFHQYGVIAQEIEKIYPDMIDENEHGIKNVSYIQLIPVLIEAIKELTARVEQLEGSK